MRGLFVFAALTMLIAADSRSEDADSRLIVESDAAIAKISLRSSSRPVRLPNLSFNLRIQALCPAALEPESISISIADTRVNIRPDDGGPIERTIRVPRKQLGPGDGSPLRPPSRLADREEHARSRFAARGSDRGHGPTGAQP